MKEHRVRYLLNKLNANGVCYSYPFLNYHRLGYLEFNLFIAVKGGKGAARQRLVARLAESPAVKHVGVLGGEYHIDVQLLTRSLNSLRTTMDTIARDSADIEYQVDTLLVGSTTYFAANFLGVGQISEEVVVIAPSTGVYEMDDLDKRIIQGLFTQKAPNVNMLAREIGITQSTLQYRIERLKKEQVLLRMGYMLDHLKIGFTLTSLLIKAKRPSMGLTRLLTEFSIKSGCACFLVECYGAWDYQIGGMFEDQTRLSHFVDKLFELYGDQIDRVVPVPSFETVKWQIGL